MSFFAFIFGCLGAVAGSFIGVIAERLNTGHSFVKGRSRCNSCARLLGPRDLVPVLSWLVARGRCYTCGARIPWVYAVIELTLFALFAYAFLQFGFSSSLAPFLIALSVMTFIVVYDFRHTIVPPTASILLFLSSAWFLLVSGVSTEEIGTAVLTAGIIALFFFLLHVLSGGRAMGLGDAPVAFSLSLLIAPYAVGGLLCSFWIGGLCGLFILVSRQGGPKMGIEVPFVPFLAAGYLLAYLIAWNPLAFLV